MATSHAARRLQRVSLALREADDTMTRVLALVPARGQSKRLPRKNVRPIAGRPLIAWTVKSALESGIVDRIVVTTDDEEIRDAAVAAGAEAPFMRPADLATDTASSIDVVIHALDMLGDPEIVVLLQPTSPLRSPDDILACVDAVTSGAPAAVTVTRLDKTWPVFRCLGSDGVLRAPPEPVPSPTHLLTGSVYAIRSELLRRHRTFLVDGVRGIVTPAERSVDIDVEAEFELCAHFLSRR